MSWKLEIWQNKHIAAEKEQTADTKRSFSLANTIQSTTIEPRKNPTLPQEDSQFNTIWTGTFVPFCAGVFNKIEWTDSECKEEEEEDEKLSHTPWIVRKETQYGKLTNDQLYICCFFSFLFFFYDFFPFCCLHNETPCIGWEIQKRTSSGKWWSQMCKL